MSINYLTVIVTLLNFALLFGIILFLIKMIQGFRSFLTRNKEMNNKLDKILNKMEEK